MSITVWIVSVHAGSYGSWGSVENSCSIPLWFRYFCGGQVPGVCDQEFGFYSDVGACDNFSWLVWVLMPTKFSDVILCFSCDGVRNVLTISQFFHGFEPSSGTHSWVLMSWGKFLSFFSDTMCLCMLRSDWVSLHSLGEDKGMSHPNN